MVKGKLPRSGECVKRFGEWARSKRETRQGRGVAQPWGTPVLKDRRRIGVDRE